MSAKVYVFANQKGGVAKTTTTVNLAAYLAAAGKRVLMVDMDPQSNATTSVGIDQRTLQRSIYNVIIGEIPAQRAITLTGRVNLDLLPATTDLAGAEVEMAQMLARERLLERALRPLHEIYDYILIDEPPSLGLLTINGLTAAKDGVIIPVQCEYLALEGLSLLLQTIRRVRDVLNDQLIIAGVVLTMFDARTRLSQDVVSEVRQYFPHVAFRTVIPRSVRLSEAPSHGQPISEYAPNSAGGLAYQALAKELIERVENQPADVAAN